MIGILLLSRESRRSLVGFQSEFRYILPGFIRDPASFSGNPGIFQSKSHHIPVGSQYILTGIYIGIPPLSRDSRNFIPVESSGIPDEFSLGLCFVESVQFKHLFILNKSFSPTNLTATI